MAKKGNQPGGGTGSRAMHAPTTYFTGHPGMKTNPGGVAQLGQAQGNKTMTGTTNYKGDPVKMGSLPKGVPLGNQTALEAGQGPGSGRTVSRCGSQQGVSPSTPIGPT